MGIYDFSEAQRAQHDKWVERTKREVAARIAREAAEAARPKSKWEKRWSDFWFWCFLSFIGLACLVILGALLGPLGIAIAGGGWIALLGGRRS